MVARSYTSPEEYRYGFNGQEREEELSDSHTSAEYWMYDGRLGRRWNVDPIFKEYESPYVCFANNPIWFVDSNGADSVKTTDGRWTGKWKVENGNTLWALAKKFNTTVDEIKAMNTHINWDERGDEDNLKIYPGEIIKVQYQTFVNAVFDITTIPNEIVPVAVNIKMEVSYEVLSGIGKFNIIVDNSTLVTGVIDINSKNGVNFIDIFTSQGTHINLNEDLQLQGYQRTNNTQTILAVNNSIEAKYNLILNSYNSHSGYLGYAKSQFLDKLQNSMDGNPNASQLINFIYTYGTITADVKIDILNQTITPKAAYMNTGSIKSTPGGFININRGVASFQLY